MLTHLHIRDFAIICEVELELREGLTVLTGETGAGKSIVVDALGLVLGDRADPSAVRHGAERAEITAGFDITTRPVVARWLRDQLLDAEGECLIRRVISREGRSRAYVNGRALPLQSLRELGEHLVDIHGQQEHQSLVRRQVQREILDYHGDHGRILARLDERFRQWRAAAEELSKLEADSEERVARMDLLRYQVKELEALALQRGEIEELEAEHRRLANTGALADGAAGTLQLIYDDEDHSAQASLSRAAQALIGLGEIDARLQETREMLMDAEIQTCEAADNLRRYLADLEVDPARQQWVEDRIGTAQELARKHRITPRELPARLEAMRSQLEALETCDLRLEDLAARRDEAAEKYRRTAAELSRRRQKAAASLNEQVTNIMQQLGMPGGCFTATITPFAEQFRAEGLDRAEFLVSANPGQPPRSLAKVASGGELSRIGLAIEVVAADGTQIPSMVFDEVDAGIGGGVAEIVGRRLRNLGRNRQVLCVTHLPQVASQAHHHVRVNKLTDGKITRTTLRELPGDEKIEELARMLGGVEITAKTRAHAQEMIARAQAS